MTKPTTSDPDLHEPIETTVQEMFGLTDAEVEMFDCRLALAQAIRETRKKKGLTQPAAAKVVGVAQPRISAIERGDLAVSFDLMAEAFFALGKTRFDLAKVLAGNVARPDVDEAKEPPVKRSRASKRAAAVARTRPAPKRSRS